MHTKSSKQKFVAYYRVSTQKQGCSGLGLDAQKEAVEQYIHANGGVLIASITETESGKKISNRPELQKALDLCKRVNGTLVIAKLDRLARSVLFIATLMESNVDFVAVDHPTKDRFLLHIFAAVSEMELVKISVRTKEALAAAKRRGIDIGATGRERAIRLKREATYKALEYRNIVNQLRGEGFTTLRALRDEMNRRNIPSPGGGMWHLPSIHRLCRRISMATSSS